MLLKKASRPIEQKNGNVGFVVVNPPEEVIQDYSRIQEKIKTHQRNLETLMAPLIGNHALGMDSSKEIERLLMTQYPLRHT